MTASVKYTVGRFQRGQTRYASVLEFKCSMLPTKTIKREV
jgi:hypothetical protein